MNFSTMVSAVMLAGAVCLAGGGAATGQSPQVEYTKIGDAVWMYTGRGSSPGFPDYSYNGVVAIDHGEAVIIDLPQNRRDAEQLIGWIERRNSIVVQAVPQHWHDDSTGSLPVMYEHGIGVAIHDKTFELMPPEERGKPDVVFHRQVRLRYGERYVDVTYFGGGHSVDGVVAWFDDEKILVGGCLLKAENARSLGNLADADEAGYLPTVQAVKEAYPDARVVTPGHGHHGGMGVIDRTIMLLESRRADSG